MWKTFTLETFKICLIFSLIQLVPNGNSQGQGLYAYREKLRLQKHYLGYMPLRATTISVSGHSSGATAATHLYLSNSGNMDGIALFSALHYQCGSGGLYNVGKLVGCLRGRGNASESINIAESYALSGLIDPLSNLRHKKHYIFHGTRDAFISFENGPRTAEFFRTYSDHVLFKQFDTVHAVPSKMCGIQCTGVPTAAGTGCSKCDFSVVFEGLNYIYDGTLVESLSSTCRPSYNNDGLTLVDQSEFFNPLDEEKVSMLPDAVLYMPPQCRVNSSRCSLHIAFHGCRHSIQNDGMDYIRCSGYLETADANNFIILFPQTKISPIFPFLTWFHCWDLNGYSGPLYGTKLGGQNQVVFRMISRIMTQDFYNYKAAINTQAPTTSTEEYYYDNY